MAENMTPTSMNEEPGSQPVTSPTQVGVTPAAAQPLDSVPIEVNANPPIKFVTSAPEPPLPTPRRPRWLVASIFVGVFLVFGSLVYLALGASVKEVAQLPQYSNQNLGPEVTGNLSAKSQGLQDYAVPGNLKVSGTASANILQLNPIATPGQPTQGQLYFDQADSQIKYYNGSDFVSLLSGSQNITQLVQVGPGLAYSSGRILNTGVVTLQAGTGISVSGATITNTGVTGISSPDNSIGVTKGTGGNYQLTVQATGTTLDGLNGNLTLANSSGSGTTITIDNASTSAKGIAQFNATNFSVASGVVNTIQGISTTATPTFGGLTLSSALTVGNGGTGATSAGGARTNLGAAASGANSDITSLSGLTTALSVLQGGTGSTTASGARTNLGAAVSGANGDITSLTALTAITPSSALTVGSTGQNLTLQGAITNLTSTSGGFTNALTFATPSGSNKTLTLPNETGTLCSTGSVCTGYAANSGDTNYIFNQSSLQASSNFHISGTGTADTSLLTPTVDVASAGTLSIGNSTATGITVGKSGIAVTNPGTAIIQGANALTLGLTGTNTGAVLFKGATAASGAITLIGPANPTNNTLTLPNETGTLCSTGSVCTGYAASSGDTNYIFNQSSLQASSNFHISGTGTADTSLLAPIFDVASAGTLTIGNSTATGITLGKSGIAVTNPGTAVIQSANALTLGLTGTNTGAVLFKGSTAASGTITLAGQSNPTNNTLTLPNETGTLCSTGSVCTGYAASSGDTNYIFNQSTLQASSNFHISGSGTADTSILTPTLDVASAGTLSIGNSTATAISLGKSGVVVTNAGTAVIQGANALTLGTASTNTGAILFKGSGSANTLTLAGPASPSTNTITLPNETGTLCSTGSVCSGYAASSGDTNYIFNQSSLQASSNFHISGTGTADTSLLTPGLDVASAGTLTLGNSTATAITLGKSGIAVTNPGTAVIQGASALTLGTASTNTGAILFKGSGSANTLTLLGPASPSTNTLTLPNETGTLCSTGSVCSGYAASSGSGSYIQNATSVQAAANFAIQSAAAGSVGGLIKGASGQTADLLEAQDTNGNVLANIDANGNINEVTTGGVYKGGADTIGTTNSGTGSAFDGFANVFASGRYVYAIKNSSSAAACSATAGSANGCEFQVYDNSNPGNPIYLGGADASGSANSGSTAQTDNAVFVSGRYAYVVKTGNSTACSQTAGSAVGCELQIYDVYNPGNPTYIGGADITGSTNSGTGAAGFGSVYVSGHYAYVTETSGDATTCSQTAGSAIGCELQVYDVSNPAKPTYVGGADTTGSTNSGTGSIAAPTSVFVSGRYAYVTKSANGTTCSQTAGSAVGCELQVYDVSNPAKPTYVGGADASGSTNSGSSNSSFNSIFVSGRYAYVAAGASATACSQTAGSAVGCELQVYDISNAATPTYKGGADASGSTNSGTGSNSFNSIFVSGRYAYVVGVGNATACSQTAGSAIGCELQIYDVNDSTAPTYKGGSDASGSANSGTASGTFNSISVSGRYAYIAKVASATTCSGAVGSAIGCELQVYDLTGVEATAVNANSLESGSLQVRDSVTIGNQLSVGGGLTIGAGGIQSGGPVGINGDIVVRSIVNGDDLLAMKRFTDSSPTGNFVRLQDAAGNDLVTIDISGNLTVKAATINGNITVNGHFITANASGSTTIAANTAACGTGCTASIAGNDSSGIITINTGTGPAAGTLATVTFANAFGSNANVVITPNTVPASSTFPQYYYGSTTTTFDLKSYNALSASVTYTFSYHVVQ